MGAVAVAVFVGVVVAMVAATVGGMQKAGAMDPIQGRNQTPSDPQTQEEPLDR